jgi:hypothetical protein
MAPRSNCRQWGARLSGGTEIEKGSRWLGMQIANLYLLTIYEMLLAVPKLLLLTVFEMPLAIGITAVIGAWPKRRSFY